MKTWKDNVLRFVTLHIVFVSATVGQGQTDHHGEIAKSGETLERRRTNDEPRCLR